ncbi:MAG: DUF6056 family protein [Clostridia bacterium]
MCEKKRRIIFIAVLVSVFLLMLVLNLLTPLVADDYRYAFSFATEQRIASVGDIFPSLAAHAQVMNGRLVPHFFVQLFTLLPHAVFAVVNALMYTAFLLGLYWLICGKERYDVRFLCILASAVFLLPPAFGQCFLWMSGSINYLWCDTLVMFLLIPFADAMIRQRDRPSRLTQVLLAVGGLLMGNMSENVSAAAALLMGLCILWLLFRKRRVRAWMWVTTGMVMAGWLAMMLSPANRSNVSLAGSGMGALLDHFAAAMDMFMKHGLWLSLVFLTLFCFSWHAGMEADRLALSMGLFVCALLCNFAMVASSYYPERAFTGTCILLIAACALLLVEMPIGVKPMADALAICLCFTMLLTALGALPSVYNRYRLAQARVQEVCSQRDAGVTAVTTFGISGRTRYDAYDGINEVSTDPTYFPNVYYAKYYGLDSIVIDRMEK